MGLQCELIACGASFGNAVCLDMLYGGMLKFSFGLRIGIEVTI